MFDDHELVVDADVFHRISIDRRDLGEMRVGQGCLNEHRSEALRGKWSRCERVAESNREREGIGCREQGRHSNRDTT